MKNISTPRIWIEAAIETHRDRADEIAARLGEMTNRGVWIRESNTPEDYVDIVGYFSDVPDISILEAILSRIFPGGKIKVSQIPDNDWVFNFERSCEPLAIGKKFWISPSWNTGKAPENRLLITIDPSRGFGSGRHETTQLVMEFMEDKLRPGDKVIDAGCGSGILSIGAKLLDAGELVCIEIDPDAADCARENFVRNGPSVSDVIIIQGDMFSFKPCFAPDLILANLETDIFARCAGLLHEWADTETKLILGGIEAAQKQKALKILGEFFLLEEERSKGDWTAFLAKKRG